MSEARAPAADGAHPRREPPRLLYLAAAIAAAVAAVGYLTGLRDPGEPAGYLPIDELGHEASGAVPGYADMGDTRRGPNAGMYDGAFQALAEPLPPLTDEVDRSGDPEATRAERRQRRAYDGAPPTIPHRIDQRAYPSCLACHERGAVVGGRLAPAMSHERHDSCTQCHVPEDNPVALEGTAVLGNDFVGLAAPEHGTRAWPGAPPTIPHATSMRSRCDSCHGVAGPSPMRTSHPWRQQCVQCHVPDVGADRAFFPSAGAAGPPPPRTKKEPRP